MTLVGSARPARSRATAARRAYKHMCKKLYLTHADNAHHTELRRIASHRQTVRLDGLGIDAMFVCGRGS